MEKTCRLIVAFGAAASLMVLAPGTAFADGPPRPDCGFGDVNHNHQAAPGQDPEGLRPGDGRGDRNQQHTAPPGQAPDDGGEPGNPQRGCPDDPRG